MNKRLLVYVALLASTHTLAASSTDSTITQLQNLNANSQFEQAYQLALSHLQVLEGDPAFDLQLGIAAVDSGRTDAAIFAFERVLALQPTNQAAKLELARAYFLVGQYERSEALFQQVAAHNPPPSVQRKIDQFLASMPTHDSFTKKTTKGHISIARGYDDNINAGPDGEGTLALTDIYGNQYDATGVTGKNDHFNHLEGMIFHQGQLNDSWSYFLSGELDARWYSDESELNNLTLSGRGGVTHLNSQGYTRLSVFGENYELDDSRYRTLYGGSIEYKHIFKDTFLAGPFIQFNRLEYSFGSRDSDLILGGLSGIWLPPALKGGYINGYLYTGQETPKDDNPVTRGSADRTLSGLQLSVQVPVHEKVTLKGSLAYQKSDYASAYFLLTPLTTKDRVDKQTSARLQANWEFSPSINAFARYSYTDNDSNTQLTDYSRRQFAIDLNYQF